MTEPGSAAALPSTSVAGVRVDVGVGVARGDLGAADGPANGDTGFPRQLSPPTRPRSRRLWNEAAVRAGEACDSALELMGEDVAQGARPRPWAIVVVTSSAGEGEFLRQFDGLCDRGYRGVRPSTAPRSGLNSVAAELSIELEAVGPNLTLSGPPYALGHAFSWATRHLASGEVDVALVVAVEEEEEEVERVGEPARPDRDATAVVFSLRNPSTVAGLGIAWDPRSCRLKISGSLPGARSVEVDLGRSGSNETSGPSEALGPNEAPGSIRAPARAVDRALTVAVAAQDLLPPGSR